MDFMTQNNLQRVNLIVHVFLFKMIDHCQFWIKIVQNVSFLTKLDQTCPNLFKSGCMAFQSVYKTDAVVCTYLHGNNSSCVLFFICDNLTFDKILQHNYRYNVTAVNHDNMGDICCICSQFSLGDHSIQYNIVLFVSF